VRKGFEFSLMVVGESGLGKSTLVNSMFLTDIYQSSFRSSGQKTIEGEPHTVLLEEGGVKLSLTVVDTPGFGDSVDNTECWAPVITYIENQFDKFLEAEQRVNRIQLVDSRVHACLYFIAPSGHGLRQLDIQTMKRLHDKVNIIPVVAKSDSCTQDEIKRFKQIILQQLTENSIKIYDFPPTEDPEVDWMREQLPFAVVGSDTVTQDADGKRVRGREYPWGTVNIEDRNHCDFTALRSLLLMQDLKDVTNTVHYETYRCKKLTAMMGEGEPQLESHPLAEIEREVAARRVKVDKLEGEMEDVFNRKVEEKETRLREEQQSEEQRLQEETKEVNNMRDQVQKDRETFMRESGSWQGGLNKYNFRSVKSEESLAGKKKKYGLERVCFKFGRA
jgi:septin 7